LILLTTLSDNCNPKHHQDENKTVLEKYFRYP